MQFRVPIFALAVCAALAAGCVMQPAGRAPAPPENGARKPVATTEPVAPAPASTAERAAVQGARQYPVKTALLLPLTGSYSDQAKAIEAGLLAAYYRKNLPRPTVAIYDTHGTAQGARAALTRARAEAANFIVGPLTPAGVKAVAALHPGVPTLALNYLPGNDDAPAHFYQFGLSPMQEASSAAERAVAQGLTRAVVLVPANGWGQRIEDAFARRFRESGGTVVSSAMFQPGAVHFAEPISALLGGISAQPSVAATADQAFSSGLGPGGPQLIFFAAPYKSARLIVPQIAYYGGMGLPVYSISDVYRPGTATDDLDGVNFPIMPWFVDSSAAIAHLRSTLARLYPTRWHHYASLFALGYDAWRLVPMLGANAMRPLSEPVPGVTGTLRLRSGGVIERRAEWARYVNGKPRVEASPMPASLAAPAPATR